MRQLETYTFGNSPAAVVLVRLLNEQNNDKQTRSVSRFLIAHNQVAKSILEIKNPEVRSTLIRLWQKEIKEVKLVGLSEKVFTFTKNLAVARTREIFRASKDME